jgi:hypothetical protein
MPTRAAARDPQRGQTSKTAARVLRVLFVCVFVCKREMLPIEARHMGAARVITSERIECVFFDRFCFFPRRTRFIFESAAFLPRSFSARRSKKATEHKPPRHSLFNYSFKSESSPFPEERSP